MASIIKRGRYFALILAFFCPLSVFATTPCQSGQQTWLYTVDTSNQSHIVACLSSVSGVVPWFGYINAVTSATTVTFDASLGNHQTLTIGTNVTGSTLSNAIAGEWMFFTIKEDATGGRTFQQPANFVGWHAIDTSANASTTEAGWFDGTNFNVVGIGGAGGNGPGNCANGASLTRYVDSANGSDSNTGLNWCSAKATEASAITALGAGGGWVYVAPKYTGAVATGVASNIHILLTNQLDSLGTSAQRFSFPTWSDKTEDHYGLYSGSSGTAAEAHTAFTTVGPFSNSNLVASVLGNVTVPATASAFPSEQAGVAGIVTNNSTAGDTAQSDGVYGACYNPGATSLDCSGIVGVAGNNTTGASGSFEAGWLNLSLLSTPTDAMGLVIRATGGHMPTTEIGTLSGRGNAAVDVNYGGASGDSFPSGVYFEGSAVSNWPIVFSANATTNNPHTNVYTYYLWKDYYPGGTSQNNTLSVVKINNGAASGQGAYQAGNLIYNNSANSSEVVLPLNHSGTVSVDGINAVTFSATPTFDRALGKVQTITLTANVTSSTFQNCVAGQTVIFDIIENGTGGWTFVAPANLHGFGAITTTASFHNRQNFYCTGGSSNSEGYSVSSMQSGT